MNFNFFENKMDRLNRKNIIAVIVIILVGLGLIFYLMSYKTQKKKQRELIREKLNYESAVTALAKEKRDLNTVATSLGINYFSRFPEASHMDLSFFMFNRISTLANKWKVNLINFSPAEKESKGNYSVISFSGTISAAFPDMVNFFQELEDKEKIFLENLRINISSQSFSEHQAIFDLVCLEVNDPMLNGVGEKEKETDMSPSKKDDVKTVKRDPFLNPFEKENNPRFPEKYKAGDGAVESQFELTGISYSSSSRTAIINHTMVKEGDVLEGKKVAQIQKDHVILKDKGKAYTLRLKETTGPQKREEKPLKTEEVK